MPVLMDIIYLEIPVLLVMLPVLFAQLLVLYHVKDAQLEISLMELYVLLDKPALELNLETTLQIHRILFALIVLMDAKLVQIQHSMIVNLA
jgi:hypothetical protein